MHAPPSAQQPSSKSNHSVANYAGLDHGAGISRVGVRCHSVRFREPRLVDPVSEPRPPDGTPLVVSVRNRMSATSEIAASSDRAISVARSSRTSCSLAFASVQQIGGSRMDFRSVPRSAATIATSTSVRSSTSSKSSRTYRSPTKLMPRLHRPARALTSDPSAASTSIVSTRFGTWRAPTAATAVAIAAFGASNGSSSVS